MTTESKSPKPQVQESSKTASHTISSKTTSHKTDHEDLSRPEEGIIHKKKIDTTVEQERTTRKQTETRNMVLTGKYEDIAPIIYNEMARYGASPSSIPGPKAKHSTVPLPNAETRKVAYAETKPYNNLTSAESKQSYIAPPESFGNQSAVALRNSDDELDGEGDTSGSQTMSSKTRTVETLSYKMEKDGMVETRVEHKITIKSDGDPVDHDRALADAIQEATMMDPKMTVQKIELTQNAPLH